MRVVSPRLTSIQEGRAELLRLLQVMFDDLGIMNATLWCMTSSTMALMSHLDSAIRVYDDETETIGAHPLVSLDGFDLVFLPPSMSQLDNRKRGQKKDLGANSAYSSTSVHFVLRSIEESQEKPLSSKDWDRLWSEAATAEHETARAADQFFQKRPLPAFTSAQTLQHRPSIY